MKLLKILARFRKSESGASMVEYGVALLVVTAIGVTAMTVLGGLVDAQVDGAITTLGGTPP